MHEELEHIEDERKYLRPPKQGTEMVFFEGIITLFSVCMFTGKMYAFIHDV